MRTATCMGIAIAVAAGLLVILVSQPSTVDGDETRNDREHGVDSSSPDGAELASESEEIATEPEGSRKRETFERIRAAAERRSRWRAAASNDRLSGEAILLAGEDVDSAAVGALLRSDDRFVEILDRIDREMTRDSDASELADVYREGIAVQLAGLEGLTLDRLACGLRVCAATFADVSDEAAWERWRQRFEQDVQTPHHVFVERRVALADGTFERRIVYSTDPGSAGVFVRAGPGG